MSHGHGARRKRRDFEHPHRSVPDHRLGVGQQAGIEPRGLGADVQAHPVAHGRVAHLEHFGRRRGINLRRHHVIDGQLQHDPAGLCVRDDRARFIELVVLNERLADRHAECLEEGVGHRPANQQAIDASHHVTDDIDLVGHLGAANDCHERPIGSTQGETKKGELLLHQEPRAGRREVLHHARDRRMRPVRHAKRIVDVNVSQRSQFLGEAGIVLFFRRVEAQVFEQHDFRTTRRVRLFHRADCGVADAVVGKRDLPFQQLTESRRDRLQAEFRRGLALGAAHV